MHKHVEYLSDEARTENENLLCYSRRLNEKNINKITTGNALSRDIITEGLIIVKNP